MSKIELDYESWDLSQKKKESVSDWFERIFDRIFLINLQRNISIYEIIHQEGIEDWWISKVMRVCFRFPKGWEGWWLDPWLMKGMMTSDLMVQANRNDPRNLQVRPSWKLPDPRMKGEWEGLIGSDSKESCWMTEFEAFGPSIQAHSDWAWRQVNGWWIILGDHSSLVAKHWLGGQSDSIRSSGFMISILNLEPPGGRNSIEYVEI